MSQSSGLKHIPWNQVAREPLTTRLNGKCSTVTN